MPTGWASRRRSSSSKTCPSRISTQRPTGRYPSEIADYIATPKDNLYQSIHTTVLAEDGHPLKIQVRTHEMDHIAEYGVTAHWLYKEGKAGDDSFEQEMVLPRQIPKLQRDVSDTEEFVDGLKSDILSEQVSVYTPRGDCKYLPAGSHPIDFAFRVNPDLIFSCIGAKVNGKPVSLKYQLENGDTCQILTSKTAPGPSLDWLNEDLGFVRTKPARAKVRQWLKRQDRPAKIQHGRKLYQSRLCILTTQPLREVSSMMRMMGFDKLDDFFAALVDGSTSVAQVVSKLSSREKELGLLTSLSTGIHVMGVGGLLTSIARCCNPINGEEIVGLLTRKCVTIHRPDCPKIRNEDESERLVDVTWGEMKAIYPVRIQVKAMDRVGLLRDVTSIASAENVNISGSVSEVDEDVSIITLTLLVRDLNQLSRLFFKLDSVEGVTSVTRSNL